MPDEFEQLHVPNTEPTKRRGFVSRKVAASIMAVVMIFSATVSYFAVRPQPAQALFGLGDISITLGDIPRAIEKVVTNIKKAVEVGIKQMAINSLYNVIDNYVQNVAYETGRYLGSGGTGQKPLVFTGPVSDVFKDAGDQVLGDYLDQLSTQVFGQSLCEPLNPQFKLQLTVMLEQSKQPRKPKCSFGEIFGKGGSFDQTFRNIDVSDLGFSSLSTEDVVKFSGYFDPGANELAALRWSSIDLSAKVDEELRIAELQRQIFRGYEPVTNPIDGKIKTSAESVAETEKQIAEEGRAAEQKKTELATAEDSTILLILTRALTTFSRTFIGEWTKQVFEKGVVPTTPNLGPSDFVDNRSGLAAARQFYQELIEPNFATEVSVDVTSQLANCPDNLSARQWQNCRIDPGLKQAIDQELTLEEAMSREYGQLVNPAGIFGYDGRLEQEPEVGVGYPLTSLTVLRRYSIVPVGFELAAEYIKSVQSSSDHGGRSTWTVQGLADCYESDNPLLKGSNVYPKECRIDPSISCEGADPNDPSDDSTNPLCVNPFYHLVNPNWVLKSPATQCYQEGPGPQITYEEFIEVPRSDPFSADIEVAEQRIVSRVDWCADEQRCIQEDENGDCDFYGYCVKDKPIVRFDGEKCSEPVFDTCRQLSVTQGAYSAHGNAGSSDTVAYLKNTLVECEAGAAGCSWYSTYFDTATQSWEGHVDINDDGYNRLYVNANAQSCSVNDAGCSLFYDLSSFSPAYADSTQEESLRNVIAGGINGEFARYSDVANVAEVYLKKPPAYLDCSYANPNKPDVCDNYALECSVAEVGCEFYHPVNGDPSIPGKITAGDQCTAQCVGFATFTYTPSWFEDASDGTLDGYRGGAPESLAFVPATGQSCTQVGCEAFTNEDLVAQGGEGLEYYTFIRQCVTPGTAGTKTYFTWEGSDTSGYQLKRWVMLEGFDGSPCTAVVPGNPTACADTAVSSCTAGSPTCLTLFDDSGRTFSADLNDVVYSSDDCSPLRRSKDNVTYFGIPSLSQSCAPENVDCREYRGAGSNNVQVLFVDTFDEIDPISGLLDDGWSGEVVSSEALLIGGHSYATESSGGAYITRAVQGLEQNKYYTLQFLAKSTTGGSATASFEDGSGNSATFATVDFTAEWAFYQIGPVQLDHAPTADEFFQIDIDGFIDDIVLKESTDNYALIENSWNTQLATDCANEGAYNCQLYEVGSQETEIALKSFTSLCSEDFIGCTAFIDSQNSTVGGDSPTNNNPFAQQTWNVDNNSTLHPNQNTLLDDLVVPADAIAYYVNDPNKSCSAFAKGCQIVGQPQFDRQSDANFGTTGPLSAVCEGAGFDCLESTITSFENVAIMNNPDAYAFALCGAQDLFCSEYATSGGGTSYYVDPGNRTCEFRKNVYDSVAQITRDGWFQTGTELPCVTTGVEPNQPVPTNQVKPDTVGSAFWAGLCPLEDDTCSQIIDRDPLSGATEEVHYVRHNTITDSIARCNEEGGLVDREGGCRLFADMSEFGTKPDLYSASAYDPTISLNGDTPQSSTVFTIDPVTGEEVYASNNSNTLIWVEPDRVCDQFLHCASSLTLDDNSSFSQLNNSADNIRASDAICLGIGLCTELDENGKCIDGAAQIAGYNSVPGELTIVNDVPSSNSAYTSLIDRAKWTTGMTKFGGVWPNGTSEGLFSYHQMQEIGSPITLPNSDFENERNFGHEFSSWPDVIRQSNGTTIVGMQNATIVKRNGGVTPFDGQRMLSLNVNQQSGGEAFVTTAALPAAQELEMAVSFFVNFNTLIAPNARVCTEGHVDAIGSACTSNAECLGSGAGVCSQGIYGNDLWFCKIDHNSCQSNFDCGGGTGLCGSFTCEGGANDGVRCDPNTPETACGTTGGAYCAFRGSAPATSVCSDGAASKIGNSCSTNADCAPTVGSCEAVTSGMYVRILRADGQTEILSAPVELPAFATGWQQVSVPFVVTADDGDEFRVQLQVLDPLNDGTISGSVSVDGFEIRSGLKISYDEVVAPSCRVYANSEALSCDYQDFSSVTGAELKTYKGWRGYCVEKVPDTLNDTCMNWWPVDVVQGDVNFFGAGDVVDVNIANNLYYCLHATGDTGNVFVEPWAYTHVTPIEYTCTDDGETRVTNPLTSDPEFRVYDYEVGAIYIEWHGPDANSCRGGWPTAGQKHQLKPIEGDTSIWTYNSGDLWCDREGCTGYEAFAYFDETTGLLRDFKLVTRDTQDPDAGGFYNFNVTLKDVCQTVARVNTTEGLHTPWLSRFENGSDELMYSETANAGFYGAIASPSNDYLPYESAVDNPWLIEPLSVIGADETLYCGNGFLPQSCSRAGTPYSTQSTSGGTYNACVLGATGKLSMSCTDNSFCADAEDPESAGLCAGYIGPNTGTPYAMDQGIKGLSQLFARSYDIYGWDWEAGQYVLCDGSTAGTLPLSCLVPTGIGVPSSGASIVNGTYVDGDGQSRSGSFYVMEDYDITGCGWTGGESGDFIWNNTFICDNGALDVRTVGRAPQITSMSVKRQTSGDIRVRSGEYVPLQFYPNVDENRQPLKSMRVDWGDGTPYKPNQDLSNLSGQGLPITNYIFTHQFVCGPSADSTTRPPGLDVCVDNQDSNCWNETEEKCQFVPRVQLKDNWGWCTNNVYQCELGTGWVPFAGRVLVDKGLLATASCTIAASASAVNAGESVALTWSRDPSMTNVTLTSQTGNSSYSGTSPGSVSAGSGTATTAQDWVAKSETYILEGDGVFGDQVSCAASFSILPTPPNCTLTPQSATVVEGSTITLNYTTNWANQGILTPDTGSNNPISMDPDAPADSGSVSFVAGTAGTYTYTLAANNTINGLSGTCQATVTVSSQVAQCTLEANPTLIIPGGTASLNWTVDYAHISSDIQPEVGTLSYTPPSGSGVASVAPDATTVYTLTASGNAGSAQCRATVTVNDSQCTDGNTGLIGNACVAGSDCEVSNDGVCDLWNLDSGYCEYLEGGVRTWSECFATWDFCDVSPCRYYECSLTGAACDPGSATACDSGTDGTCSTTGAVPQEFRCRAGWDAVVGTNACPTGLDSDCNSAGPGICTLN